MPTESRTRSRSKVCNVWMSIFDRPEHFITVIGGKICMMPGWFRTDHHFHRWVSIRIDLIGNTLTTALAAYMVYDRKSRSAGEAGFSLSMAVVFSQLILWWSEYF